MFVFMYCRNSFKTSAIYCSWRAEMLKASSPNLRVNFDHAALKFSYILKKINYSYL